MFDLNQFNELSKITRDNIIESSIAESASGNKQNHSINTICEQKRELAIAARMTSKPFNWNIVNHDKGTLQLSGESKKYYGEDIANIFIESAKKFGKTYYPVTGDWSQVPIKQLILFVKTDFYHAIARFEVKSMTSKSGMNEEEMLMITDVTPIANSVYKTVLEIELIEDNAVPQDYLGNKSGISIYDLAFKGPSPNILVI